MRRMSRCLTWVPISGLGEPKLYQNLGDFTRIWDFGEFLVFFQVLRILFRRCGFDSLIGIHIEDILGNQIQW